MFVFAGHDLDLRLCIKLLAFARVNGLLCMCFCDLAAEVNMYDLVKQVCKDCRNRLTVYLCICVVY